MEGGHGCRPLRDTNDNCAPDLVMLTLKKMEARLNMMTARLSKRHKRVPVVKAVFQQVSGTDFRLIVQVNWPGVAQNPEADKLDININGCNPGCATPPAKWISNFFMGYMLTQIYHFIMQEDPVQRIVIINTIKQNIPPKFDMAHRLFGTPLAGTVPFGNI